MPSSVQTAKILQQEEEEDLMGWLSIPFWLMHELDIDLTFLQEKDDKHL